MRQLRLIIAALFLISPFAANAVLINFDTDAGGAAIAANTTHTTLGQFA